MVLHRNGDEERKNQIMKRVSFGIVIAALLVSAPRLTLAFILGDGIRVPEQVEVVILTVTGVGSGVVLTIGNAVLAHALAVKAQQRSWLWWLEACAWLLFLVGAVVVMAPTLVAGLTKSSLNTVLPTTPAKWLWAVTAVVIVELLVGAAMAASILAEAELAPPPTTTHPSLFARLGAALVTRLEQSVVLGASLPSPPNTTPAPMVENPSSLVPTNGALHPRAGSKEEKKAQALAAMLAIYSENPDASPSEVGQRIGCSAPTVRAYRKELYTRGQLPVRKQQEVEQVPKPLDEYRHE